MGIELERIPALKLMGFTFERKRVRPHKIPRINPLQVILATKSVRRSVARLLNFGFGNNRHPPSVDVAIGGRLRVYMHELYLMKR